MQHLVYGPIIGVTTDLISSSNVITKQKPVVPLERIVSSNGSWCVRYTDGWMEQGGYEPSSSMGNYASRIVSFGWSFSGSPVIIDCQPFISSSYTGTGDLGTYGTFNITNTSFTYRRGFTSAAYIGFYWIAKGVDPNWSAPEPTPTGDAYVEGNTLYAGDSVINDTVNMIGGAVNNNILEL